jgi:peptidoglycan/xylan/chitin deacetylase (PgdA/CDA1 family)
MKLGVRDRIQAVELAYETGFVTPGHARTSAARQDARPDDREVGRRRRRLEASWSRHDRKAVLSRVQSGSIVVMHDNLETHEQTVQALPGIIEGLQARGYHLVTITQLLGDGFLEHRPPRHPGRLNEPVRSTGE